MPGLISTSTLQRHARGVYKLPGHGYHHIRTLSPSLSNEWGLRKNLAIYIIEKAPRTFYGKGDEAHRTWCP